MAESAASNSGTKQKKKGNNKWRVHVKGFEAVILYPALVTPCLVESKTGCMTVILAVKDDFKDRYELSWPKPIGVLAAQALHSQLCLVSWGDGAVPGPDDFHYIGHKRQVISQKHMIYLNHIDAVNQYEKTNNYQGWYLGEIDASTDFLVRRLENTGKFKPFGVIHRGAAKMYVDSGFKYLIQLEFKNFVNLISPGMYELCYVYFKLYNDADDLKAIEQDAKTEGKEATKTETRDSPPQQPMRCDYTDPDDDVISQYFAQKDGLDKRPKILREPTQIKARKPVGYDKLFQLYGEVKEKAKAEIEVKRPNGKTDKYRREYAAAGPHYLQSRHPVFIYPLEKWGNMEPWRGRIGVLGDLHVSSRQSLYPLANAQVIPGADPEVSPYIGTIVHRNLDSVTQLMDDIAKQSDLLALVGDLYDHLRNLDPLSKTVKTTGDLWQALSYTPKVSHDEYPREIDGLLLLSRILDIYGTHRKPVVYVAGNHEAYKNPFGISPRVVFSKELFGKNREYQYERANSGVAADHNLTFYEAVLLYGPGSRQTGVEANVDKLKQGIDTGRDKKIEELKAEQRELPVTLENESVVAGAATALTMKAGALKGGADAAAKDIYHDTSKDSASAEVQLNFQKENFNWLYCLYSPWKDFVISCGSPKPPAKTEGAAQPPAAGGRYNFIALGWGDKEDFLTTTMNSTGTLPRAPEACTSQQRDLTEWAVKSGAEHNILLSHFTFVSYDQKRPFNEPKAKIDLNDGESNPFPREMTGESLMSPNDPHQPQGHSPYDIGSFYKHRKAMYDLLRSDKLSYAIAGHSHRAGMYPCPTATGSIEPAPKNESLYTTKINAHKVLVCGSSGPFSYRNLTGELAGLGMDFPQGFILDVGSDDLTLKKDKRRKPRLAVVLDYLWYEGECPAFSEGLHLTANDRTFYFLSSEKFKRVFQGSHPFQTITLVAMVQDEQGQIQISPSLPMTVRDTTALPQALYPLNPSSVFAASYSQDAWDTFKDDIGKPENVLQHFLSITFRDVPAVSVTAANYDLESPWCFPVTVEITNGNYGRIYRPKDRISGELPDRDWYQQYGDGEYGDPNKK